MIKYGRLIYLVWLAAQLTTTTLSGQSCVSEALQLTDSVEISRALESCLAAAGRQSSAKEILVATNALALHHSGNTLSQLSHWLEAERYLERIDAVEERRQVLRQIGGLYRRENFPARALEFYQAAWLLLPNKQWTEEREGLLYQIADMHKALKHLSESQRAYQELLDYYVTQNKAEQEEQVLRHLADLYSTAGQPAKAREYYFRLESLAREHQQTADLAAALNNIGYTYHRENQLEDAYRFFLQTYHLQFNLPRQERLSLFQNLAICALNRKDSERALDYIKQAQDELAPSAVENARLEHLRALILLQRKDYVNALRQLEMALLKGGQDRALMADLYKTGAEIYQARYELTQAIDFYQRHIRLKEAIETEERLRRRELDEQLAQMERTEKEIKLLLAREEVRNLAIRQLQADNERIKLGADKLVLEGINRDNDLRLLRQQAELDSIRIKNELLDKQRTQSMLALAQEQLHRALADGSLAAITQQEAMRLVEQEKNEREVARQIDLLNKDKAINQLELERQLNFRRYAYLLGAALGFILLLIGGSWQFARRNNRLLAKKNQEVEAERSKAEALLLNILPDETAQELKQTGQTAPRAYPEATVVFTDFSDFTALASNMSPVELLAELNECFIRFDDITEAHGLEKIKVIGDSYMYVGGLPAPLPRHAHAAVAAALEMQIFIEERRQEHLRAGKPYWQMRVGVHTGPVVAGVVGKHKFSFDIWGDTVNTASRLEGAGMPGRINVSTDTYRLIKDTYTCQYRGELDVKGKGEIGMYFIAEEAIKEV